MVKKLKNELYKTVKCSIWSIEYSIKKLNKIEYRHPAKNTAKKDLIIKHLQWKNKQHVRLDILNKKIIEIQTIWLHQNQRPKTKLIQSHYNELQSKISNILAKDDTQWDI